LRNFFGPTFQTGDDLEAEAQGLEWSRAIALRASTRPKAGENEPNLSHGETQDFASLVVSHWNHYLRNHAVSRDRLFSTT
jgi:hypothetical protein